MEKESSERESISIIASYKALPRFLPPNRSVGSSDFLRPHCHLSCNATMSQPDVICLGLDDTMWG